MRVLFCTQTAHTGGGVEAWLETLTEELTKRGVDVHTALASGRLHDPVRYRTRHRVSKPVEVDGTAGIREIRIANLLNVFHRLRPDVVVPLHLADAFAAAAYAKTRGFPLRLALTLHSQSARAIEQAGTWAPFIDLAVSVSRRGALQLERVLGKPARTRHIPTGVPPPLAVPPVRTQIRNLAYIGRLDQDEKRALDAIPLVKALAGSEMTFHFVGSGPVESILREALHGHRVVFHGDLPREELYRTIYPDIDALVVFSPAEAGPIVVWEAMTHAVIPIVSDYIGRTEEGVVRDGDTGMVFPVGEIDAAVHAIRHAAREASALSQRARSGLPAAYSLDAFGDRWNAALTACVSADSRKGTARDIPSLVSPGRIARLGLSLENTARLRRLFGRRLVTDDPGAEWPH